MVTPSSDVPPIARGTALGSDADKHGGARRITPGAGPGVAPSLALPEPEVGRIPEGKSRPVVVAAASNHVEDRAGGPEARSSELLWRIGQALTGGPGVRPGSAQEDEALRLFLGQLIKHTTVDALLSRPQLDLEDFRGALSAYRELPAPLREGRAGNLVRAAMKVPSQSRAEALRVARVVLAGAPDGAKPRASPAQVTLRAAQFVHGPGDMSAVLGQHHEHVRQMSDTQLKSLFRILAGRVALQKDDRVSALLMREIQVAHATLLPSVDVEALMRGCLRDGCLSERSEWVIHRLASLSTDTRPSPQHLVHQDAVAGPLGEMSLLAYWLERMDKPDLVQVFGLPPAHRHQLVDDYVADLGRGDPLLVEARVMALKKLVEPLMLHAGL